MLLNGAPGSGKSTLASRFAENHPFALVLDVDRVRGMLGRWLDDPYRAGLLGRRLAVAMADSHLTGGHDVIVPQYLGRVAFVRTLERTAIRADAAFVEVALVSSVDDAVRRFERRSMTSADPAHLEAAQLQNRRGGPAELAVMYDQLLAVIAARPQTHLITTVDGDVDAAYTDLATYVNGERWSAGTGEHLDQRVHASGGDGDERDYE